MQSSNSWMQGAALPSQRYFFLLVHPILSLGLKPLINWVSVRYIWKDNFGNTKLNELMLLNIEQNTTYSLSFIFFVGTNKWYISTILMSPLCMESKHSCWSYNSIFLNYKSIETWILTHIVDHIIKYGLSSKNAILIKFEYCHINIDKVKICHLQKRVKIGNQKSYFRN
jgi:hypothetical protein